MKTQQKQHITIARLAVEFQLYTWTKINKMNQNIASVASERQHLSKE